MKYVPQTFGVISISIATLYALYLTHNFHCLWFLIGIVIILTDGGPNGNKEEDTKQTEEITSKN